MIIVLGQQTSTHESLFMCVLVVSGICFGWCSMYVTIASNEPVSCNDRVAVACERLHPRH